MFAPVAAPPGGPPRLVGRADEIAVLERAVERAAEGVGGLLWVEGEPGIGKSALAGLLGELASARGLGVLRAGADELMSGFPLRLMAGCLGVSRQSGGLSEVDAARNEIAALLRGDTGGRLVADPVLAAGERMLDLVDRLCVGGPQVMVLDDLHWADEPSLRLWGRLADSVDQIPLLLVGVSRTVSEPAVLERLRDRVRRRGALLRPGPLDGPQVRELAALVVGAAPGPGLLAEIARAQGNPLYVVELVEALRLERLIEPVARPQPPEVCAGAPRSAGRVEFTGRPGTTPGSLTTVIGARLSYLDIRVRTTLRLAALLGTEFSVAQLARLAGLAPAELITVLAAAQEAGVVGPGTKGMVFRHVLIQQVLIEQTPVAVRDALHGEIALTMVGAGAGASLDAVARHLLAMSGPFEAWAVAWLVTVPVTALYSAPQVADELLARALEGVPGTDADWLVLTANLAQVRFWVGRDQSAVELAGQVANRTEDVDKQARMWVLATRAAGRAGAFKEVAAIAEQALAAPGLPLSWRARIECWYAMALKYSGAFDRDIRMARESLAHALAAGDPLSIAYARHVIQRCAPSDAAIAELAQAGAALGQDAESADLRIVISVNHAMWRYRTENDPAVRETIVGELVMQTERMPMARGANILRFAAGVVFEAGRWDEALGYLAAIDPEVAAMPSNLDGHGLRALIYLLRGDRAAAEQELAVVDRVFADPEMAPNANRILVEYVPLTRAMLAETAGDPAGALALLEESLLGVAPDEVRTTRFSAFVPELVRLGLLVGRPDAAERAVRALQQLLETVWTPALAAAAEHAAALLAGDPVALLAAADTYGAKGWVFRRGYLKEEAAVLFAEAGSVEQARAALTGAADHYAAAGAVLPLRRLESRLREHGIRRGPRSHHRRASSGWAALTPTERVVAGLLGRGMSNPQIAERLFLSRYTVQAHVSRILAKLGFTSRVEVARAFADGRLPEPQDGTGPES